MKNIKKQTKFVIVWGEILKLRGEISPPPLKALKKTLGALISGLSFKRGSTISHELVLPPGPICHRKQLANICTI